MSLFDGDQGNKLRHLYKELSASDLSSAIDPASAKLLVITNQWGRLAFIDNDLLDASEKGVIISVLAVAPNADPSDVTKRLHWLNIGGCRVINYAVGDAPGISFDPGTKLYIYTSSTPATGFVRIALWG